MNWNQIKKNLIDEEDKEKRQKFIQYNYYFLIKEFNEKRRNRCYAFNVRR